MDEQKESSVTGFPLTLAKRPAAGLERISEALWSLSTQYCQYIRQDGTFKVYRLLGIRELELLKLHTAYRGPEF